jgi:cytochrome c biogenesis protein CcmG/thiol:disulfide interchange protein DsbE
MTRGRRNSLVLPLVAAATALAALATGCSGSPQPTAYTFNPGGSNVRVDTPGLRALKAAAHIEACPAVPAGRPARPGSLPDITLPCLGGGRSVDLAGLRGPLVLNLWAQTCGPCREEAPVFQTFAQTAGGRVRVLGVDFYDPRPTLAIAFAREFHLTYPQLADPEAATKAALHVAGLPITYFVDRSGQVAYTNAGAITSESQLVDLVKSHLGVTVSPRAAAGSSS